MLQPQDEGVRRQELGDYQLRLVLLSGYRSSQALPFQRFSPIVLQLSSPTWH